MRRIILSSVTCLSLPHVLNYVVSSTIFEKKNYWIYNVFWFPLQILSETFLIQIRIQRNSIIKVHWSSCQVPVFLSDFNQKRLLWADFRRILKYQTLWKAVQWEPCCCIRTGGQTDGPTERQTDMTSSQSLFASFRMRLKNITTVD
jgi:hypothetical protein